MCSGRPSLLLAARRSGPKMEHLSICDRRFEGQGEETGVVEYVLTQEPLQGGSWI